MTLILVVEDNPKIRAGLALQLQAEGFAPDVVESAEEALARFESSDSPSPDLLLLDVRLPGMSGVDLVRRLKKLKRLPPTIVISGEASIGETVEALKMGVHDFVEKPFTKQRLLRSIRNTLEHTSLKLRVARLESEVGRDVQILGISPAVEEMRKLIAQAAPTEARVLIRGESGTGKELVANALHRQSPRCDQAFIKINCAALPPYLVEDELFGHVRGAFTDAHSDKAGLFEEASGGTLFLDEIGDMEVGLQSRLLRVLEDGRVRRLGATVEREIDVRVVAATNTDLEEAIQDRRFRQDLYFRLAHLPIEAPPLRHRLEDIRLLFDHFLEDAWQHHRVQPQQVDEGIYPILKAHSWPGNIRELKSLCERLVVFGSDSITPEQLPSSFRLVGATPTPLRSDTPVLPWREFKARTEKQYIESVLSQTGWNVAAAARLLGIQRTYLHQKLSTLGCHRPRPEDPS